jgi:hypothetical protein
VVTELDEPWRQLLDVRLNSTLHAGKAAKSESENLTFSHSSSP